MPGYLVLYVRFRTRPGRKVDFCRHLYKAIEAMKHEPASVSTIIHGHLDRPDEIILYEIWRGTRESWLRDELPREYRKAYEEGLDELIEERNVEWFTPLDKWGSSLLISDRQELKGRRGERGRTAALSIERVVFLGARPRRSRRNEARLIVDPDKVIRYSMQFASWKERKQIAGALKSVYRADNAEAAASELEAFDQGPWGRKFPAIAQSWRRNRAAVIPFFAFPTDARKIIYTIAIESLNASVRKAVCNRGRFPSDQAAVKLIRLALRNITENWKNPPISWHAAKAQLATQFAERFVLSE